jgi:hypothetical protein
MNPTWIPPTPPVGSPYRSLDVIEPRKMPWWLYLVAFIASRLSTEWRIKRRVLGGHWERLTIDNEGPLVRGRWHQPESCRMADGHGPMLPLMNYWIDCEEWP